MSDDGIAIPKSRVSRVTEESENRAYLNYRYLSYENGWLNMQQMLRDGQIDTVTSVRKTDRRRRNLRFDVVKERKVLLCKSGSSS